MVNEHIDDMEEESGSPESEKPRFPRQPYWGGYWFIDMLGDGNGPYSAKFCHETGSESDERHWAEGNYFASREDANAEIKEREQKRTFRSKYLAELRKLKSIPKEPPKKAAPKRKGRPKKKQSHEPNTKP